MPTSRNFDLSQSVTSRDENVDDRVAALLVGGANITVTYDDAAGTLTVDGQSGYTDTDVGNYLSTNGYATQTAIVAAITDSAPTTLDTLNELAAALGDDPNFATTVTNQIGTKLATADFDTTADTWLGTKSTFTISSTDDSSSAGPVLELYRNSATPASADYIGQVQFSGENSNGGTEIYAKVTGKITDPTLSSEDALIETAIKGAGSFTIVSRQRSNELQLINGVGLSVAGNTTLSGNVGIGTNQPTDVLDVRSGATGRPTFVHASGYGGLQLAGTGAGSGASLIFSNDFNNTVTPEFSIFHDGSNDNLVFISGDPADVATQEKMRLSDNGLQIRSNSYNILNVQTDFDDNGTSDDGIIKITNSSSNTTKAEFRWDESEDAVQIAYGDHGRHIVIKSSGDVGIGTPSPQTTLDTGYTRVYNSGAATSPTSGKGLEVHYVTSGRTQGEGAYLIPYDRDNSAYKQFTIDANNINLATGGSTKLQVYTNGNISVGHDQAGTTKISKTFTTVHDAANRGKNMRFGMDDGSFAGMEVATYQGSNASFNSQSVGFYYHDGGIVAAEGMKLDHRGRVTIPNQPGFRAGRSSNYTPGSQATIVFNTTSGNSHFNDGGHYSTSTGRFTAPVAGKYFFTTMVIWGPSVPNNTAMTDSFRLRVNGSVRTYSNRRGYYVSGSTGDGGYYTDTCTDVYKLSAGDYVEVWSQRTLSVHGNDQYTIFSGYLLG